MGWKLVELERADLKKEAEKDSIPNFDHILQLRLSQLARHNMGIRIYSEVLGCEIWLCGNEKMAAQIKEDDPGAMIYTANELKELCKLQPSPEDLRAIHSAKDIFEGSKIVNTN